MASIAELTAGQGPGIAIEVDPDGFDGLALQRDPSAASWVTESLCDRGAFGTVGALVPQVFTAYARVDYQPGAYQAKAAPLLFEMLARQTQTPDDAWFCLWEGYGGLGPIPPGVTCVRVPPGKPMRSYLLYRGALSCWNAMAAFPFLQVPDLVWPSDRAWFLGTDTDLEWGFLGGTAECMAVLKRQKALGVMRVEPGHRLAPEDPRR